MSTVQVVIDEELLRAADEAARKGGKNRSALVREALRAHLRRLRVRELEEQDRAGYERVPADVEGLEVWEEVAAWPDD